MRGGARRRSVKEQAKAKAEVEDRLRPGLKDRLQGQYKDTHEQLEKRAGTWRDTADYRATASKTRESFLAKEKARLDELEKQREQTKKDLENNKNFVGCDHFYQVRFWLFGGALSFQIFQALTYPSLEEVPALIMLLLLCGLYPIRRAHPKSYGALSFFMIYFL